MDEFPPVALSPSPAQGPTHTRRVTEQKCSRERLWMLRPLARGGPVLLNADGTPGSHPRDVLRVKTAGSGSEMLHCKAVLSGSSLLQFNTVLQALCWVLEWELC